MKTYNILFSMLMMLLLSSTSLLANNNNDYSPDFQCLSPTNLGVSDIMSKQVTLSWDAMPNAVAYLVQVKSVNGFREEITTASTYTLTNLSPETTYRWRVASICRDGKAEPVFGPSFTTQAAGCCNERASLGEGKLTDFEDIVYIQRSACTPPSNLSVTDIMSKTATLSWDAVSGALAYIVEVKSINGYHQEIVLDNYCTLTELSPETYHRWRVASICRDGKSEPVFGPSFTTLAVGCCDGRSNNGDISTAPWPASNNTTATNYLIHPNPVRDYATVTFDESPAYGKVEVVSLTGAKLAEYELNGQRSIEIPVTQWPGSDQMVLVRVMEEGKSPTTRKLVISR